MSAVPFVDLVIDERGARATVPRAHLEALCAGHFPGDPIVPGAYLAGLMADLGTRLLAAAGEARHAVEVERCSFREPLRPQAAVVLLATAVPAPPDGRRVDAEVQASGRCVARARLRFA